MNRIIKAVLPSRMRELFWRRSTRGSPGRWRAISFIALLLFSFLALFALVSLLTRPSFQASASNCAGVSTGLVPLTDLGRSLYKGKQGGLYPSGSNARPNAHESAGLAFASAVRPLNVKGKASKKGSMVLLSIGMSNTTMEFSVFKTKADADPAKNPRLIIVDGAQGGMSADVITNPSNPRMQVFWQTVDSRLTDAGVTNKQVQVVWLKEADPRPIVAFPADATRLQAELETIIRMSKERFPHLLLAYCSSRIYGGYASSDLNPEPFAYQSGFSVKWMIEKQIEQSPDLNFDPLLGPVMAPWIAWGPYLWADGLTPRSDGLTWSCVEYNDDGTHPSSAAREKVAGMLLDFFKNDRTAQPWFRKQK